jgi:tripartite-type tricarboxylate transporter receptor subunit TctC
VIHKLDAKRRKLVTGLGALSAVGFGAVSPFSLLGSLAYAQAQNNPSEGYPARPIRLLCPFAAAGGVDITARTLGQALTQKWGQPVVVENKPGANGTIAVDQMVKAAADGYMLSMISSSHSVNVTLQRTQPYDLLRDIAPITQATIQPYVLVVNPAVPANSVQELIALAKAKPGKYTYGSSGLGGLSHLDLTHIPYKGGALAMSDVISGQIDMLFSTILQSHGHIASGRLKPLAVTTIDRSPSMPNLPTMREAGVADYDVAGWYGVVAPSATPAPILNKLNLAMVDILRTNETRERLSADGSEPVGSTREAFTAFIAAEVAKWRMLIKRLDIRSE